MDDNRIEEIVWKVFEKANEKSVSKAKSALANQIANEITEKYKYIHPKTLERAYDRYINKNKKQGIPQGESIELFCQYLGFKNYADYIKKYPAKKGIGSKKGGTIKSKWIVISIVITFVAALMIYGIQKWPSNNRVNYSKEENCMTWADSIYIRVSCTTGPLSKYGTRIEPIDEKKIKNFKKVKVTAAYQFFTIEGKPRIWYLKNKNGEIEYFTAPGLHPVNEETLRKITEGIIQKYVPIHTTKEDSFVE